MSYPGNPSLAPDIQNRITGTFQQTLTMTSEGRSQEAILGCEFILGMDPQHGPARQLLARLRSGQQPVMVQDLMPGAASSPLPPAPAAPDDGELSELEPLDSFDDLGGLDDLGELDDLADLDPLAAPATQPMAIPVQPAATAIPAPPPAPQQAAPQPVAPQPATPQSPQPTATGGLGAVLQDLIDRRNFQQVMQVAETQRQAVMADAQLRALVQTAQEHLESEPYVKTFLESAQTAWAEGDMAAAQAHLEKARSLDAGHPDVQRLGQQTANTPPPATPSNAEMLTFDEDDAPLVFSDEVAPPATPDLPTATADPAEELDDLDDLDDLAFGDGPPAASPTLADTPPALAAEADQPTMSAGPEEPKHITTAGVLDDDDEDEDSVERITSLLQEGEAEYERGEYQAAINVWSRIFLIQLDNQEASRRIELARGKKAELERKVEELFHEGADYIQNSQLEEAKESLRQVLEIDPEHALAKEYLQQLDAGQVPNLASGSSVDGLIDEDGLDLPPGVMDPEALQAGRGPDSSSMEAAVKRDRVAVVKKTDWKLVGIGAVVLIFVLGAAFFLATKWKDLFPNSAAPVSSTPPQIDAIARATKMHESGNVENAVAVLERVPPIDPLYEDAQALLAQWKAQVESVAVEAEDTGPSTEKLKRRELLLNAARNAFEAKRYLLALKYFENANRVMPLESEDVLLKRQSEERLQPLETEIAHFQQGEYLQAIPSLWRKREESPQDPNIKSLLLDSYYNLALRDLQRSNPAAAAEKLLEAREVEPDSDELNRLLRFAQTYSKREQDLLYRIMVKYLPSRS